MAIGLHSDLKIYHRQFHAGTMQRQAQMIDGIVGGSRGSIVVGFNRLPGDYAYTAIFDNLDDVARRDLTSTSAQTATAMVEDESISVKINRKLPLRSHTVSAFKNQNLDPDLFFLMAGQNYAELKAKDMLNTGILALEAALQAAANTHDKSGSTITHGFLNGAFQKFGDHSQDIVSLVMHSNQVHGLVGQAITDKINDVATLAIIEGRTAFLGRQAVMTDAAALVDLNGSLTDTYNTLGLVRNALIIEESEPDTVYLDPMVGGKENIVMEYQAEFAYNITLKGFKWDVTNGGANPTDATLGTQTNWDLWAGDTKQTAGVRLVCDISTF